MAMEDAERSSDDGDEREPSASASDASSDPYTWREFLTEHGHAEASEQLYDGIGSAPAVPAEAVKEVVDREDIERLRRERATGAGDAADDANRGDGPNDQFVNGNAVVGAAGSDDEEPSGTSDDEEPSGTSGGNSVSDVLADVVIVAGEDVELQPARTPTAAEWDRVGVDPTDFLGFHPDETGYRVWAADAAARRVFDRCHERYDQYAVPVLKGYYTWDDYRREFFLDADGEPPTDEADEPLEFTHEDKTDALGFDPDRVEERLADGANAARELADLVDERTVDIDPEIDEDAFFSTPSGTTTLVNRYDLEKAVPMAKKRHFREVERYWVNEPYAFVIVFHSTKENERKYYAIQPHLTRIEADLQEFLTGKLRTSIKYADESITGGDEAFREDVIADETHRLLARYDLYEDRDDPGVANDLLDRLGGPEGVTDRFGVDPTAGTLGRLADALGYRPPTEPTPGLSGIAARPEPAVLADDPETLSEYQVEKLLYYLKRDFIGYERIDPIKHDINVEDISCDGYESPVFVYHSEYEQVISNVYHGTEELDDFVVKLAQRSGKGISKRRPQVDATLPDGSRAQLTLGREVSDHGTNYTIRQFNDVPFTPVDLINWKTFSLDQMAFLWLCIENHKSLLFAGGTASGKTTSLNAVSLFIPSNAKIVSIEDTREVELPQRNWIASVTRPSFSDDDKGDIDEFDLLEAALRQRPDYIVMGEIRGEEGRTAFQVMSTGHTTYTTFHADSVGEVLKRFTTQPINVSKTMFTALDLVSVQSSTRVQGRKVRRSKSLTEINHYDAENDEINVQDVYQWQAETDEFLKMGDSNTLEEIMFDRGWSRATLDEELRKRRVVLAYLIDRGLNTYAEVAATFQAFINDPETILALMANDDLERSLEDLREMESVLINVEREKEELVPRPDPDEAGRTEVQRILAEAEDLFETYRGETPDSVADALLDVAPVRDVEAEPGGEHEALAEAAREAEAIDAEIAATIGQATGDDGGVGDGDGGSGDDDGGSGDDDGGSGDDDGGAGNGDGGVGAGNGVGDETAGGTIDFDEPFDEGVNVLDPDSTAEHPADVMSGSGVGSSDAGGSDTAGSDAGPGSRGVPSVGDAKSTGDVDPGTEEAPADDVEREDPRTGGAETGNGKDVDAEGEGEEGVDAEGEGEEGVDAEGEGEEGVDAEGEDESIEEWDFGGTNADEEG